MISNSEFRNNDKALYIRGNNPIEISGSGFHHNERSVAVDSYFPTEISNSIFTHNGYYSLSLSNNQKIAPSKIWNCSFTDGDGSYDSYAVNVGSYSGGMVMIENNNFINNNVRESVLKAYTSSGSRMEIKNCQIINNSADRAMHLYYGGYSEDENGFSVSDTIVQGNRVNNAVYIERSSESGGLIENCTIVNNFPKSNTENAVVNGVYTRSAVVVKGSNIYGHNGFEFNNQSSSQVSNVAGNYWGTDNNMEIVFKIYDEFDNSSKTEVSYQPYLTEFSQTAPPVEECAVFNSSDGKLHIPCVFTGSMHWVDLVMLNAASPTFELSAMGKNSGEFNNYATYEPSNNSIHVPCLDVGVSYKFDLVLIKDNPATFELRNLEKN